MPWWGFSYPPKEQLRVEYSAFRIGSFGMWIRPKWFVTPRGRIASNSGCTAVLVLGAMTPNFMRQPSASTICSAPVR